jgi:arsenate reductase-like glutaredoxin family protein
VDFEFRHLEKDPLSIDEIKKITKLAGIEAKDLINPKSRNFKALGVSNDLAEDDALELLTKNPKIMYRPIVLTDNTVLLKFNEKEFEKFFNQLSDII